MRLRLIVLLCLGAIAAPWAACAQEIGPPELRTPFAAASRVGGSSAWHEKSSPSGPVKLRPGLSSQFGYVHAGTSLGATNSLQGVDEGHRDRSAEPQASWDLGGVVGYQYPLSEDGRESVGVSIQIAPDVGDAYERLLLQPGFEYQTQLSSSLNFNARLYSTYAKEGLSSLLSAPDRKASLSASSDLVASSTGFRDVGIGVGVGYSVSPNWAIQTQAGVTRSIGESKGGSSTDKGNELNTYFGGVVINYQF